MPARGPDGRFVRDEGLNFNISIFTILKYLIVFAAIFPWYKLIEKQKSLIYLIPLVHLVQNVLNAFAHYQIQPETQLENSIK